MAIGAIKKHTSHHHSKGFLQNVMALVAGGVVAFVLIFVAQTGKFTADIMNQYGHSVENFSGAELVYHLTDSGMVEVLAKRNFDAVQAMVFTVHYNPDIVDFDTNAFVSKRPVSLSTSPNTLTMMVLASGNVAYDDLLISLPYHAHDPWIVQDKTVFMGMVDFGEKEMEDLIIFTQTSPKPEAEEK